MTSDQLWKGLRPGAVTSAAKLTGALRQLEAGKPQTVELEEYEIEAVGSALAVIGLG